jgi:metallo-beta-lactamase family protein
MAHLTFLGAARTVTGSQYVVEAGGQRVMVDCGMFQGLKELRLRNWAPTVADPAGIDHVVLTHTHLDHIGRLPRLVREGFGGRVSCTPATAELAEILLRDAARLQEEDADYLNRNGLTKHAPAQPLFTEEDVQAALERLDPLERGQDRSVGNAITFRFRNAGHLLGASSVQMEAREKGQEHRVFFSGDVGRYDAVLAQDPEPAPDADYLVVESTYGNRAHPAVDQLEVLQGVLERTFARGGVVLIPAFAVGRAQQLLVMMDELVTHRRLRPFAIHLDSPMAIDATGIYARHPGASRTTLGQIAGRSALLTKHVQVHRSRAESQKLNDLRGPAVIISSSGMLSGGRVLHHCRQRLPHAANTLLITGYQAEGTLGRALLDGRRVVRIHKGDVPVLAEITELRGLSGHADATELLRWLAEVKAPRRVFCTHGEPEAAEALAARLTRERGFPTAVPGPGEAWDLATGARS